jgi:hypothetical protein
MLRFDRTLKKPAGFVLASLDSRFGIIMLGK